MADVLLMEEHPAGCTVCMAVSGPFVVYKVAGYIVQTVEGPLQVDTEFALCARRDGRDGCTGQGARLDGFIGPDEAENLHRQHAELLERHTALETAHDELEASGGLDRKKLAEEIAETLIEKAG